MPKETVRLFILLFISLLYALFKFSANLPSMPEIHSIRLLFTGSLDHLRYCTVPPTFMYFFVFVKSLLPLLINTLNLLKEEYRIYLASLQQADIHTRNPYRNSPRES